jgi:hypothetical protein
MDKRDRLRTLLNWHNKESSERATRRYLGTVSSVTCMNNLDKALGQRLDNVDDVEKIFSKYATTNSSGIRVWNRDSFARHIKARLPEIPAVTTCVTLLWRIFYAGAYFPFLASTTVPDQVSSHSNQPEVDLKAFKRAFAFLVLRGYELLGTRSDGNPFPRTRERCTDNVPRLARIIFKSLSTPSPQTVSQSDVPQESLQLQDVKDTIAFTQPVISASIYRGLPWVPDEEFEPAAHRLLLADHELSVVAKTSCVVSKAGLKSLVQLFLLQHIEDRRWRNGLPWSSRYQRSGDIQFSHFIPGPEEASRASQFASAFLVFQFEGSEESVTWNEFKGWCSECVNISPKFLE